VTTAESAPAAVTGHAAHSLLYHSDIKHPIEPLRPRHPVIADIPLTAATDPLNAKQLGSATVGSGVAHSHMHDLNSVSGAPAGVSFAPHTHVYAGSGPADQNLSVSQRERDRAERRSRYGCLLPLRESLLLHCVACYYQARAA